MKKKEFFPMWHNYLERCKSLSDAEFGRLVRAMLQYSIDGTIPKLSGREAMVFEFAAFDIDAAAQSYANKCETQRQNISKRWHPEENTTVYDGIPWNDSYTNAYQAIPNDTKHTIQNKTKQNKTNIPPNPPESDLDVFEGPLREVVEEWLRYKHERREDYKPVGRKSLLSQIASNAKEYGDEAVADVIRESMSSGYKGIVFDRLARPAYRKADKPSRDAEMDELVAEFMRDRGKG